jgi:hypothetical protein
MGATQKMSLGNAWKNWYACLNGDDPNSIFRQITIMIWDTSIFHIILAARQSQVKKNPQVPEINDALHSFIDRNYFQTQTATIRRLTSKSYKLTGTYGVYSIGTLLKDIESYKTELTRKSYLELKNMPYNYEGIRRKEEEYILSQPPGKGFFVPPEFDWQSIEEAHCVFDRLANVSRDNRNPTDQIADHVFKRLIDRLSICNDITTHVDKFIAHSSTPESRSIQNYATTTITLRHLWEAHRVIFEVAYFLSTNLFSEDHLALAIENPTFFKFWDKPLIENGEFELIKNTFENYRKETEAWQSDGVENIWRAIEV